MISTKNILPSLAASAQTPLRLPVLMVWTPSSFERQFRISYSLSLKLFFLARISQEWSQRREGVLAPLLLALANRSEGTAICPVPGLKTLSRILQPAQRGLEFHSHPYFPTFVKKKTLRLVALAKRPFSSGQTTELGILDTPFLRPFRKCHNLPHTYRLLQSVSRAEHEEYSEAYFPNICPAIECSAWPAQNISFSGIG